MAQFWPGPEALAREMQEIKLKAEAASTEWNTYLIVRALLVIAYGLFAVAKGMKK